MCEDDNDMGIVKINSDQQEAKYYYTTSMKIINIPRQAEQLKKKAQDILKAKEIKFKEVLLDPKDANIKVRLGVDRDHDPDQNLTKFHKNIK